MRFDARHRRLRLLLSAATCLGALVYLALAVVHSAWPHAVDQYSVDHLMPGLTLRSSATGALGNLLVTYGGREHSVIRAGARLVAGPASAYVSVAVLVALCAVAWRRGARALAALWTAAFAAASACELAMKSAIVRPALVLHTAAAGTYHITGFDSSFPSGHATRAVVLAAFAVALWPGLRTAAAAWVALVSVLLVAGGFHTPTDVAGGLLLGAAIVLSSVAALRPPGVGPAG